MTPGRPLPDATLLEHSPFELLGEFADTFNQENTLTPAANPVRTVGLQNRRLQAAFREPIEAADLTLALWTAEPGREFTVALRGLANAPPRQRGWCWDSVMPAITAAGTRNAHHVETMVAALVKHLPADPALRLRVLRQAVDGLVRHPRGWAGALAPLLTACAAEPHLPDVVWQQLMRMVAMESRHSLQAPAMYTAFGAIASPARRAEFSLAADIAQMTYFGGTVVKLEGLLQRIGALPPGPLATVLYDELFRQWRASCSRDSQRGVDAIRHAMLAAADKPGYREAALARLPAYAETPPEVGAALAAHAGQMRPEAAMRLVMRHLHAFATDPKRLPRQCAESLQRARAVPAEHLATTLTLARVHAMSDVDPALARLHGMATTEPVGLPGEVNPLQTPEQRADLARLVMAEVPLLPLAHRLQVLAAIEPRDYSGDNWQEGWNRAWQQSLQAICQGVLMGGLDMTRRDAIRALAAALPHEQRRGRVPQPREGDTAPLPESTSGPLLQALSLLLRDLPQHELAAALLEIQPMLPSHHACAGPSLALVQLLLRCCESLPFELRAAPLDALEIATHRQVGGAKEAIVKQISRTRVEAAAWKARSRALVQARAAGRN